MVNLKKIKILAQERKMTIAQLAKEVGVIEQSIHNLIAKNTCNLSTLTKISEALGVSEAVFFDDYPTPTAQANGEGSVAIAGNNNVTIPHEVLVMLADKDKQLREKDELIAKLTNKLLSL